MRVALVRNGDRVLLVKRGKTEAVMPSMWELPAHDSEGEVVFTVRHAIMDTDYLAEVVLASSQTHVSPGSAGMQRWFSANRAAQMPLTGLARKILRRANIIN